MNIQLLTRTSIAAVIESADRRTSITQLYTFISKSLGDNDEKKKTKKKKKENGKKTFGSSEIQNPVMGKRD